MIGDVNELKVEEKNKNDEAGDKAHKVIMKRPPNKIPDLSRKGLFEASIGSRDRRNQGK